MFEYQERSDGIINVRLFRKRIGTIQPKGNGFCYRPNGSSHTGPIFSTVQQVKRDIEAD